MEPQAWPAQQDPLMACIIKTCSQKVNTGIANLRPGWAKSQNKKENAAVYALVHMQILLCFLGEHRIAQLTLSSCPPAHP